MDGGRTYATPIINQIGVDTQNEVVKKRKDYVDNSPYGQLIPQVKKNIFKTIRTVGQLLVLWII
jgi:hypothetical protein